MSPRKKDDGPKLKPQEKRKARLEIMLSSLVQVCWTFEDYIENHDLYEDFPERESVDQHLYFLYSKLRSSPIHAEWFRLMKEADVPPDVVNAKSLGLEPYQE